MTRNWWASSPSLTTTENLSKGMLTRHTPCRSWREIKAKILLDRLNSIKRELCEVLVLGVPTGKGMFVLDTDASVVAISGKLHQEQEWNGRTVLRPIACGSKVLSDTEIKYGAPKTEMFAVITFVEKYRAYLGSAPFKLRVDNRALDWLKTYSMDQSYIGRWIVRLDGYHMIIGHRTHDTTTKMPTASAKRQNVMSDWKRSRLTNQKIRMDFHFGQRGLRQTTTHQVTWQVWAPHTRTPWSSRGDGCWHKNVGEMWSGSVGFAILTKPGAAKTDQAWYQPHSLAKQNGERGTGCHAETLWPAWQRGWTAWPWMDGYHAEVDNHRENGEESSSISESGRWTGLSIDSESVSELDSGRCPSEDLVCGVSTIDRYSDCSRGQRWIKTQRNEKSLVGRHEGGVRVELWLFIRRRNIVRGVTLLRVRTGWIFRGDDVETTKGKNNVRESTSERPRDRILSGESRNIMNKSEDDDAESIGSSDDSQSQLSQSWENRSETTSNSDVSEIAIHSLLVEWKQRGLDREMH